jgi:DNA modification methylase
MKKATVYNIGDMKTWQDLKRTQSLSDRGGLADTMANKEKTASYKSQGRQSALMNNKKKAGSGLMGGSFPTIHPFDDYIPQDGSVSSEQTGTSIFDPVLCELVYRWFCVKGGSVLDPFAGGSVRGIVASYLGYIYTGIDLSQTQIEANRQQAEAIGVNPTWIVGDSRNIKELAKGEYDLIFSCPPYYDLEVYSDNPDDLSVQADYEGFISSYR